MGLCIDKYNHSKIRSKICQYFRVISKPVCQFHPYRYFIKIKGSNDQTYPLNCIKLDDKRHAFFRHFVLYSVVQSMHIINEGAKWKAKTMW